MGWHIWHSWRRGRASGWRKGRWEDSAASWCIDPRCCTSRTGTSFPPADTYHSCPAGRCTCRGALQRKARRRPFRKKKKMKTRNVSLWVQVRHEKSLNGNKLGGWPHKLIPHGQQKMDGWKLWVRQWLKTCKKTTYSWHFPIQIYCGPQINCLFVWVMVFEKKTCICVLDGWTAAHQLTESKSQLQEDEY